MFKPKQARHFFYYILYKIAYFLAVLLPLKAAYALGSFIADIKCALWQKDTQAVKQNFGFILGKDNPQVDIYAKKVFRNFAKYLVDFLRFSKLTKEYIRRLVKIEGLENLDNALAANKGVVCLTAHIGSWELAGAVTSLLGYRVNAVAVNHSDPRINSLFINQRVVKGINVIPLGGAMRNCFKALRAGEVVGVLGDVDFARHGIELEFFGKKTIIPKGPATMSIKTGAAIIPTFLIRQPDDTFKIIYEKPLEYKPTGHVEKDIRNLTIKIVEILENYIRTYPDQWLMMREFWTEPGEVI